MFGMLGDLAKAAVGVVVTPVAMAADIVTLGGELTDRKESYTESTLKDVVKNLENATKPD